MGEPVKDYRIPTEEQWDAFEERMKKKREEEEAAEKKQGRIPRPSTTGRITDIEDPNNLATPREKRDAALQAMVRGR